MIDRRTLVSAAVGLSAVGLHGCSAPRRADAPVVVLVHGAWQAPWRDRIVARVYLDAFVPRSGERMTDYMAPGAAAELRMRLAAGDARLPKIPARAFGLKDPQTLAWVERQLTDHPAGTYVQPLTLAEPASSARKVYIACTTPRLAVFDETKARIRADAAWRYIELEAGHDAMVEQPSALAALLADAALATRGNA